MTGEKLTLRVPRELRSPNAWLWKHWRVKQRETRAWERDIWTLIGQQRSSRQMLDMRVRGVLGAVTMQRHRVTVTRIVPSRRRFIRDDDNLRFAVKPVNDALKRLGVIHDDSREWLEQPMPVQVVGPAAETIIEIETL